MKEENKKSKLLELTEEAIDRQLASGLNTNNIDVLVKLTKIKHMETEDENMNNYGNYYGRTPGHGSYGGWNYGNYGDDYGRRGYDMKYRGENELDRMHGEYGRYQDYKNRYGAGEETDKSFHYMVKALEDFIRVLHEEANTPQQKQQLNESLQRSMI